MYSFELAKYFYEYLSKGISYTSRLFCEIGFCVQKFHKWPF
jgi:hypothetical protein